MLLSIAIPTYNRAAILRESLEAIISEINNHKDFVELIISDNCSTDNTPQIIEEIVSKNRHLDIKHNKNPTNTGYYGNFKKCREMAQGKFFWLLSDNEKIQRGVLPAILSILKYDDKITFIRLRQNWQMKPAEELYYRKVDLERYLKFSYSIQITKISNVIIRNNKEDDNYLFNEFDGNEFLGFLLLISAMKQRFKVYEIYGRVFDVLPAAHSFNVFKVWTYDMTACLSYLRGNVNLEHSTINIFVNNYIRNILFYHVYNYRIYGKIGGKNLWKFSEIKNELIRYYGKYSAYNDLIKPLLNKPLFLLFIKHYIIKIKNKLC